MGARTQGVGRGVRWDAFGNIASLLARAGQARGEGYAALGAGIGGGINAYGANKRREKERAEDATYRKDRDAEQDRQWQASFDLNKSNIDADNARQDRTARGAELAGVQSKVFGALKMQQEAQEFEVVDLARRAGILKDQFGVASKSAEAAVFQFGAESPQARSAIALVEHVKNGLMSLGPNALSATSPMDLDVSSAFTPGGPMEMGNAQPPMQGSVAAEPVREGAAGTSGPRITIPGLNMEVSMGELAPEARDSVQQMMAGINTLSQARDEDRDYTDARSMFKATREAKLKEAADAWAKLREAKKLSHDDRTRLEFDAKRKQVVATATVTATGRLEHMVEGARGLARNRRKQTAMADEQAKAAAKAQREQAEGAAMVKEAPGFKDFSPEIQDAILGSPDPKWAYGQHREAAKDTGSAKAVFGAIQRLQNTRKPVDKRDLPRDRDGNIIEGERFNWDMKTESMNDLQLVLSPYGETEASPEMRAAAQAEIQRRQGVDPAAAGDPDVARVEAEEKRLGRPLTDAETVSLFGKGR